jgi:hypothetical protein
MGRALTGAASAPELGQSQQQQQQQQQQQPNEQQPNQQQLPAAAPAVLDFTYDPEMGFVVAIDFVTGGLCRLLGSVTARAGIDARAAYVYAGAGKPFCLGGMWTDDRVLQRTITDC